MLDYAVYKALRLAGAPTEPVKDEIATIKQKALSVFVDELLDTYTEGRRNAKYEIEEMRLHLQQLSDRKISKRLNKEQIFYIKGIDSRRTRYNISEWPSLPFSRY